MAFGLTGPSFSVGGGLHAALEALAAAALLVEGGDADRVVVVAADEVGPATRALGGGAFRSGAVALLVTSSPDGALARIGAMRLRRGAPVGRSSFFQVTWPCFLWSRRPAPASSRVRRRPTQQPASSCFDTSASRAALAECRA